MVIHKAVIHKAEPAPEFAGDASSVCVHCHRDISRVPGGRGPVWVHTGGAVIGVHQEEVEGLTEL